MPECTRRRALLLDDVVAEHREQLFERDARLEPRQRGAEAVVDAVTERDVTRGVAPNVELIGGAPAALVAIRRTEQQQDLGSGAHRLAVQLDVAR